jgi:hypothetical protein
VRAVGFRGPSAAICPNLHPAEALEGFAYDATVMMQTGAWDILNNKYTGPAPITRAIFDSAQDHPDLLTISGTGEYTWYLDDAHYALTMELAKHDFHACFDAGIPFVSVAHVSPMFQTELHGSESEIGVRFYRELLRYCRDYVQGKGVRFTSMTLQQYTNRVTSQPATDTELAAGAK